MLARARAEAQRLLAHADADAEATLAAAQREADDIRGAARAEGESDAAAVLAAERARVRRQARAVVLAAQRKAYDQLRSRVAQALATVRDDPGYRPWLDGLAERARAVLGADALVREAPDGGVIAETNGRRGEYTLVGLADQVMDAMGTDIEGLWSP